MSTGDLDIETDRPRVILGGAGDIKGESLEADKLEVDLRVAGKATVADAFVAAPNR